MLNVALNIGKDVSRTTTFALKVHSFSQYYHIYKNGPTSTVYISENSKPAQLFTSFLNDSNIIKHLSPFHENCSTTIFWIFGEKPDCL